MKVHKDSKGCTRSLPAGTLIATPSYSHVSGKKSLGFFGNIPIISYMTLRIKCAHCGGGILIRYPVVECLTAFLLVLLYRRHGISLELTVNMVLILLLATVSLVDLDSKTIPDALSIGGILAGLVAVYFRAPLFFWRDALYGILVGGGVLYAISFLYRLLTKSEAIGGGDMKLLAMIGSFCGVKGVLFSLVAGSFIGTAIGASLVLLRGMNMKFAIPFGPFLSLGAAIYLFQGDRFVYAFRSIVSVR